VPLFERLPRRLRLTAAGALLVAHARRTLTEYRAIEDRLSQLKGLHGGEVALVTMNGLAGGLVPRAVAAFGDRFPRIRVTMRVMFVPDILRAVADGEAQLGLGYHLPDTPGLDVAARHDCALGAVVAAGHPLAGRAQIRLAECAAFPLILADPSMRMHQTVQDAFRRAGAAAEPASLSNSVQYMKAMAEAGRGIAFLSPFDITEEQRAGRLVLLRITDQALANPLSLVHRARETLDPAAAMLADHLRDALAAAAGRRG
jgi:DNA-binding transcriptional LysR family regulator